MYKILIIAKQTADVQLSIDWVRNSVAKTVQCKRYEMIRKFCDYDSRRIVTHGGINVHTKVTSEGNVGLCEERIRLPAQEPTERTCTSTIDNHSMYSRRMSCYNLHS